MLLLQRGYEAQAGVQWVSAVRIAMSVRRERPEAHAHERFMRLRQRELGRPCGRPPKVEVRTLARATKDDTTATDRTIAITISTTLSKVPRIFLASAAMIPIVTSHCTSLKIRSTRFQRERNRSFFCWTQRQSGDQFAPRLGPLHVAPIIALRVGKVLSIPVPSGGLGASLLYRAIRRCSGLYGSGVSPPVYNGRQF